MRDFVRCRRCRTELLEEVAISGDVGLYCPKCQHWEGIPRIYVGREQEQADAIAAVAAAPAALEAFAVNRGRVAMEAMVDDGDEAA